MKIRQKIKYYFSEKNPVALSKAMFFYNFHKILNLNNPSDINEKIQYLKLFVYSNNSTITQCVDKFKVKEFIKSKNIDELRIAENYTGALKSGDELAEVWKDLPSQFVVKCNHGCGFNYLVTNKDDENLEEIVSCVNRWLRDDQWKLYCEPQYKDVNKCCFVEQYLGADVEAYKFYCFNGEPQFAYVSSKGDTGIQDYYLDYFDMEWNWVDINLDGHCNLGDVVERPMLFDDMIEISRSLSTDFPFVRVDLYEVEGCVYFSELTFVPTGGNMKLRPRTVINEWGKKLDISSYVNRNNTGKR